MVMESSLPASSLILDSPVARRTAKFHPSIWGDSFTSYLSDETTLAMWREKAQALRREVQEMLSVNDTLNITNCSAKLSLIDAIQRLGIAYHFEEEIERELARVFTRFHGHTRNHVEDEEDLNSVALRFRLLREHGYNVTSDIFNNFMDKGMLKDSLKEDVNGVLSHYEATQLRVHGETILDLAHSFTETSLKSMLLDLSPMNKNRVVHALNHPVHKGLPRLGSVYYFSIYKEDDDHNETLLAFAMLDFNIVQKLHQQELSILSKWWKDLDFASKLPFARDRLVECYFWILGVYFEPKYALARRFLTQVIAMTSVVDDIYDAYGTKEELKLFTKAINKWDKSATFDLPEYMKIYYHALLDVYNNMEKEMIRRGKPIFGVQCAKEAMKGVIRAYHEETKWLDRDEFPTMEEYMRVALVSSAYPMLAVASFVGMENDVANEEAFEWILEGPKISRASALICRLMDDIVSHEFERERGHTPSAVECFSRENGVSEIEAQNTLRMKVENAWKDVNEGLMRPTPVARALLMRLLNMCRVMEVLYKESDGYTHVNATVKEYVVKMLSTSVQV